jgi:Dip2/Utp12 Family
MSLQLPPSSISSSLSCQVDDEEEDLLPNMVVSPSGRWVATWVTTAAAAAATTTKKTKNSASMDPMKDDTTILVTIYSSMTDPHGATTPIQTIRIPPPVFTHGHEEEEEEVDGSATMPVDVQFQQRRRLLWLGGGNSHLPPSSRISNSKNNNKINNRDSVDDLYLGVVTVTTTMTQHQPPHPHHQTTTTTTTCTVLDRARGVPIYTMHCDDLPSVTVVPMSRHISNNKNNNSKKKKNDLSVTESSSQYCIGIVNGAGRTGTSSRTLSGTRSNEDGALYFYIASERSIVHPPSMMTTTQNQQQQRKVVLYECHISTGQIVRKIKMGSSSHHTHPSWFCVVAPVLCNHTAVSMAICTIGGAHGAAAAAAAAPHVIKGINLIDGTKLYKLKLPWSEDDQQNDPNKKNNSILTTTTAAVPELDIGGVGRIVIMREAETDVSPHQPHPTLHLFQMSTGTSIPQSSSSKQPDSAIWSSRNSSKHSTKTSLQMVGTLVHPTNDDPATTTTMSTKTPTTSCLWLLIQEEILLQIQLMSGGTNQQEDHPSYESYTIERMYRIDWNDETSTTPSSPATFSRRVCFIQRDQSIQLMAMQQQQQRTLQVQTLPLWSKMEHLSVSLPSSSSNTMVVTPDNVITISFQNNEENYPEKSAITMVPDQNDDTMTTTMEDEKVLSVPYSSNNTKKRPPEQQRSIPSSVLGPGQKGSEALYVSEATAMTNHKRSKTLEDTEQNEPTIAERLRLLQQALDAEDDDADDSDDRSSNHHRADQLVNVDRDIGPSSGSGGSRKTTTSSGTVVSKDNKFTVRHATTESLTQLVVQALQSSDGTMLEQAFQVRDPDVLRTTCQSLTSDQVTALLDAILQRLANKPNRAEQLVAWVTAILHSNQIPHVQHLQPLQNLLSERLEVFPLLLQLEGRLESMVGM